MQYPEELFIAAELRGFAPPLANGFCYDLNLYIQLHDFLKDAACSSSGMAVMEFSKQWYAWRSKQCSTEKNCS